MSFKYKDKVIAGYGGGSSEEVYSTEEAVIGRWIDGRPVYRKTFIGSTTKPNTWSYVGSVENLDHLIRASGYLIDISGAYSAIPNNVSSINNRISGFSTDDILIIFTVSGTVNFRFYIIAEYTKTTDQATIQVQESTSSFESPSVTIPDYSTATSASAQHTTNEKTDGRASGP